MAWWYSALIWLGVALDGFTTFGVALATGVTVGQLLQWQYARDRAEAEEER